MISFLIVPTGEEKPKLQEVGPYAYRQTLTKEDVKFSEVSSLSRPHWKKYSTEVMNDDATEPSDELNVEVEDFMCQDSAVSNSNVTI